MSVLGSWYRAEGWRGMLAQYNSPSPETKCRLTTDFEVMPVLNQYRFQCWHGTDVQYRISNDGQLPAKLPCLCQHYASTAPVLQILLRYWRGTIPVVKFHLWYQKNVSFIQRNCFLGVFEFKISNFVSFTLHWEKRFNWIKENNLFERLSLI